MRTKNSIRNIAVALFGQILAILLSFISRKVFILYMSEDLLGLNSVFANLLSILSLAELGIGSAITFSLYKPLVDSNYKEIQAIMTFYKYIYRIIAVVVASLGVFLMIVFPIIIKEEIPHLYLYYLLYLSSTVISYLCSYKRTLIIADQKSYISSICRNIYLLLLNCFQIYILVVYKSYVGFLIAQIILSFLENLVISKIADKLYPYIKDEKYSLSGTKKKAMYKDIRALMMHRIGSVIVTNTDSILLSALVNIREVAVYTNYKLIISGINTLLVQAYSSFMSSVGNLLVDKEREYSYQVYKLIQFTTYWIYGAISICLFILINDLINVWIGPNFEQSMMYVFILIANFFILGVREPTNIFKNSCGLFQKDKYKALIESIVNIVLSIILGIIFGPIGIFSATLISCLLVPYWVEPFVLFKNYWKKSVKEYFLYSFKHISIIIFIGVFMHVISSVFVVKNFISLIIKAIIVFLGTNIMLLVVNNRSFEMKQVIKKLKQIFK